MAVFMAFAMIIAMGVTGTKTTFAAGETGSIVINNTTAEKTLHVYQIFTDSVSGSNVAYELNDAYAGFFQTNVSGASGKTGEALSQAAYEYVKDQVGENGSNGSDLAKELVAWVNENASTVAATREKVTTTANSTTISGLAYGYYMIVPEGATDTSKAVAGANAQSLAMLVTVDKAEATTINMKSNYPTVEKKVEGKNATDVNVGDEVTYTLTSKVPDMTGYKDYVFAFEDTLSAGLTFGDIVSVTVGDTTLSSDSTGENTYTLKHDTGSQSFRVDLNKFLDSNKDKAGQTITVTYTATLNENAVVGKKANTNEAKVVYSNDPSSTGTGTSEPSIVDVHTFDFTIFKYYDNNGHQTALPGAKFELYKANEAGTAAGAEVKVAKESDTVYRQDASGTDIIVSPTDGKVQVKGLKAGTYYLKETEAPEGYNKLSDDIKIEITTVYDESTGKLTSYKVDSTYNGKTTSGTEIKAEGVSPEVGVENKTGAELPSTGSKGALMLTVAGAALLIAMVGSSIYSRKKKEVK